MMLSIMLNILSKTSGYPVFTVLIAIVLAGLSVLLVFSIIKEAKRVRDEKENPEVDLGLVSKRTLISTLDEFIRVYRLSREATLFLFEVSNAQELSDSFGKKNELYLKEKMLQNVVNILPKNAVFAEYVPDSDSYMILLRGNLSKANVAKFAQYLVETIEKPVAIPGASIDVSYSCYLGLAYYPAHSITSQDLIAKADLALYMNRKTSTSRFSIYESSFDVTEKENLAYYNEIKNAIKNKEFALYYQPIVDCNEGKIKGYEALIRWQHPELGVLPPNKFLSVLENSGDIIWVGKWSIFCICNFYSAHQDIFANNDIFFSINLSVKQLLNENIVDDFVKILYQNHVPTKVICLEIEEYTLYEKYQSIPETIKAFTDKGFRISIDHFGLDFNNIKKLESNKIDSIKLVAEDIIETNESFVNKKVYDILVDTCKEHGVKICSLKVENLEMVKALEEKGVSLYQGYFISAPMNEEDALNFSFNNTWQRKILPLKEEKSPYNDPDSLSDEGISAEKSLEEE